MYEWLLIGGALAIGFIIGLILTYPIWVPGSGLTIDDLEE